MNNVSVSFRQARSIDGEALTALANRAKAHWGYLQAQLEAWRADLEISPASIATHWTLCAETGGELVGVVQLNVAIVAADLLHLWVEPKAMGQGIGTALLDAAIAHCRSFGLSQLTIDSDPNAEPFYAARGARRVGETPAPIDGMPNRLRPQMVIDI